MEDTDQPKTSEKAELTYTQNKGAMDAQKQIHCFQSSRPRKYHIFDIRYNSQIELHLRYSYFDVGIPARQDFKLCSLKQDVPVEIKINGKTDFSMSSRRARAFKEQRYIFEFLGEFDKCNLMKKPIKSTLKRVPKDRKVIDLMKTLW